MQRIVHGYRNKSAVFTMLDSLYAYVSDTDYMFETEDVLWLDPVFKPLCDILETHLQLFRQPTIKELNLATCYETPKKLDTNFCGEVTVCLSGGKDSAAAAYYLKKQGYKVHLYHAVGVNKAYGDEQKAAQRIADYLGCDLFIDRLQVVGLKTFIEHPLKNYVIANGAIHYAMAHNYQPVLAFGNFKQSTLDMNEFEVCGGDCIEMWDAYTTILKKVIPDFQMLIPLNTNADTFDILSEDWQLFSMAVSCMSPYRFRAHWKYRAEQKYNVRLFDNRCGCCWKCCLESAWLMDFDKVEYNEPYYRHCMEILERTIYKETGQPADNFQMVWDNYMFYPMEKSKAYEWLKNKKIYRGKL